RCTSIPVPSTDFITTRRRAFRKQRQNSPGTGRLASSRRTLPEDADIVEKGPTPARVEHANGRPNPTAIWELHLCCGDHTIGKLRSGSSSAMQTWLPHRDWRLDTNRAKLDPAAG